MDTEELKRIRTKWGRTQNEMAAALGMPVRTYEDLEAGRSTMRPVHERALQQVIYEFGLESQAPIPGPVVVHDVIVDRKNSLTEGGQELFKGFAEAVSYILGKQDAFEVRGYDQMNGHWWARNNGEPFRLHKWWITPPTV